MTRDATPHLRWNGSLNQTIPNFWTNANQMQVTYPLEGEIIFFSKVLWVLAHWGDLTLESCKTSSNIRDRSKKLKIVVYKCYH